MSQHTTIRDLTGNPSIEAIELSDVARGTGMPEDFQSECDAAFGYGAEVDELTEREIDELYVAEMERRDAAAREAFGGDDTDPTPPAGGRAPLPRETPDFWQDVAALMTDDGLVDAVNLADVEPHRVNLTTAAERAACLDGFTRELLRRLDGTARAAA
jgi:hypothetical protein